jgi:hypothetical protein
MIKLNPKTLEFGYWFSPSESKGAPGGNRLEIVLPESPSGEYFTPISVHLSVKSRQGFTEKLKITHPWSFGKSYQLIPGVIEIIAVDDKKVEAFTLGGDLEVEIQGTLTACIVTSPAPIFEITTIGLVENLFIEELEITLAERRAALLNDSLDYDARIINIPPLELYAAILNAMIDKFDHSHHKEDLQLLELINLLHSEKRRLQDEGLKPLLTPPLEELL